MKSIPALLSIASISILLLLPRSATGQVFVPTSEGAALQTRVSTSAGASWGDFDGDGDLDVAVTDVFTGVELFRNEGDGVFLLESVLDGVLNTYGSAWADMNNDGDLDLVVHSLGGGSSIYVNEGDGFFPSGSVLAQFSDIRDANLVDFDRDGLVDVFVARRFGHENVLLLNQGGYKLQVSDAIPEDADNSSSSAWGDFDLDGDLDVYVANTSGQSDRLYQNVAGELVPALIGGPGGPFSSTGASWADVDHDGDLDLYVANAFGSDRLYRNDGVAATGETDFVSVDAGSVTSIETTSQGSAWGDVDHDGDLDLVVTNRSGTTVLHTNDGTGHFTEQALGSEGYGVSATLVDYDDDGDLDLFVTRGGANSSEANALYENTTDGAANWLQIRCVGTESNHAAIGTQIHVKSVVDGVARWQVREVQARSGRSGQSGLRVHFGLADAEAADSVIVRWPTGERQVLEDVAANQLLVVEEEDGGRTPTNAESASAGRDLSVAAPHPNPFRERTAIRIAVDRAGPVRVEVFDVLGRLVGTLLDRDVAAGTTDLEWDGRDEGGRRLSAGTYFVRVRGAGQQRTVVSVLAR